MRRSWKKNNWICLEEVMKDSDDEKKVDDLLMASWFEQSDARLKRRSSDRIYRRIQSRISTEGAKGNVKINRMEVLKKWLLRSAAVLVIPLAIGTWYFWTQAQLSAGNSMTHTVSFSSGESGKVQLADGTVIWLNACSSLQYPAVFSNEKREVYLEGEAYFDVEHSKRRPFIVNTGDASIHVLGTSFNASAYQDEDIVVSLDEGLIHFVVSSPVSHKNIAMSPGEQLVYDPDHSSYLLGRKDTGKASLWRSGILVFEDKTLQSIVRRLERRYGVDIKVANKKLLSIRYSGTFENEDMETILQVLSEVTPMGYKETSRGFVIY